MTISAGRLRHRIRIERRGTAQDPVTGQRDTTWSVVAFRRAEFIPVRSQERDGAGGKFVSSDVKLRMRYDASLNITEEDRIVELKSNVIYGIDSVLVINYEDRIYELMLKRGSRDD